MSGTFAAIRIPELLPETEVMNFIPGNHDLSDRNTEGNKEFDKSGNLSGKISYNIFNNIMVTVIMILVGTMTV